MEPPSGRDLGIQEFGHSPPTPWVLVLFVFRGVFLSFSQGGFADGTLVPGGSWIGAISLQEDANGRLLCQELLGKDFLRKWGLRIDLCANVLNRGNVAQQELKWHKGHPVTILAYVIWMAPRATSMWLHEAVWTKFLCKFYFPCVWKDY